MEISNEMKYNCELCNYKCIYPAHWKQHIESEKHKNNGKRKTLDPFCHFRFRFEAGNSVMIMTRHEHDEMQSFVLSL